MIGAPRLGVLFVLVFIVLVVVLIVVFETAVSGNASLQFPVHVVLILFGVFFALEGVEHVLFFIAQFRQFRVVGRPEFTTLGATDGFTLVFTEKVFKHEILSLFSLRLRLLFPRRRHAHPRELRRVRQRVVEVISLLGIFIVVEIIVTVAHLAIDIALVVFRVVVAVPLVHSPTLLLLFVTLIHEIFHVFQTEHAWIFKELFRAIASARFLPTLRANALVFVVIRDVFVLGLVERVLLLLLFLLLFLIALSRVVLHGHLKQLTDVCAPTVAVLPPQRLHRALTLAQRRREPCVHLRPHLLRVQPIDDEFVHRIHASRA